MVAVSNHEYAQTYTAGGNIPAGRLVALDSDNRAVLPTTAALRANVIGVAHLGGQGGMHMPVVVFAGHRVVVQVAVPKADALSAGDIVKADAAGRVVKATTTGGNADARQFWIGVVLGPEKAANADAGLTSVLLL